MADKNFIRFFIILNSPDTSSEQTSSGYCKVEGVERNIIYTLSLRGVTPNERYIAYAVSRSEESPIVLGEAAAGGDGNLYKELASSDDAACRVEAVYIVPEDGNTELRGYTNRSLAESARRELDTRLEVWLAQAVESSQSSNESNGDADDGVVEVLEMDMPEIDSYEANDVEKSDDAVVHDDTDAGVLGGNDISSYISTFARLYRGLVGEQSVRSESETVKTGYMDSLGEYYDGKFEGKDCISPFAIKQLNSKWIRVSSDCGHTILGLVYDNGEIKYIAHGVPTTVYSFCAPAACGSCVWLPAGDECLGVTGYWLTFIDAQNGTPALPDINIL